MCDAGAAPDDPRVVALGIISLALLEGSRVYVCCWQLFGRIAATTAVERYGSHHGSVSANPTASGVAILDICTPDGDVDADCMHSMASESNGDDDTAELYSASEARVCFLGKVCCCPNHCQNRQGVLAACLDCV